MIKARAHKKTEQASAPGHEDYAEKAPSKGHLVPVGFLLFVTACSAFIKSCVPFSSGAPKDASAEHKPHDPESEEAVLADPSLKDAEALAEISDEESATESVDPKKHTSNVIPIAKRFTLPADELDNLL